jgi:hypothetical protein
MGFRIHYKISGKPVPFRILCYFAEAYTRIRESQKTSYREKLPELRPGG